MHSQKQRLTLAEAANLTKVAAELNRERSANTERLRVLTAEVALLAPDNPERAGKIVEQKQLAARQVELKEAMSHAATLLDRERVRLESEVERLSREVSLLTERVTVGALRREEMIKVLTVLVAAEDNEKLSYEEYDARIDACVRRARTLLSLETAGA